MTHSIFIHLEESLNHLYRYSTIARSHGEKLPTSAPSVGAVFDEGAVRVARAPYSETP